MLNTTSVSCFGEYILKNSGSAYGTTFVGIRLPLFSISGLPSSVYYDEIKDENKEACANVYEIQNQLFMVVIIVTLFITLARFSLAKFTSNSITIEVKSLIMKLLYVKNTKVTILSLIHI